MSPVLFCFLNDVSVGELAFKHDGWMPSFYNGISFYLVILSLLSLMLSFDFYECNVERTLKIAIRIS